MINPHQRCGYSDLPFARKDTFLYCTVQKWVGRGCGVVWQQVDPKKKTFFVIENYVADVKQNEKHVPDLLEPIMGPPGLVKEELRRILFKMDQIRSKITKNRVCTFQMSGKMTDSSKTSPRAPLFAIFGCASGHIFQKMQVLAPAGAIYASFDFQFFRLLDI